MTRRLDEVGETLEALEKRARWTGAGRHFRLGPAQTLTLIGTIYSERTRRASINLELSASLKAEDEMRFRLKQLEKMIPHAKTICDLLELGDLRAMACDGPVGDGSVCFNQLNNAEKRQFYKAALTIKNHQALT